MERDHLEDVGVEGSIILCEASGNGRGRHGLDYCGSGQGQVAGWCGCGDEPTGSIKCGEFLD